MSSTFVSSGSEGGRVMSTEVDEYRALASEREELEMSTASRRVFDGTVWPLIVLCIAAVATLAWSIFLAWTLFRLGGRLIK